MCPSKTSSVAFASPRIGEAHAHADMSSAAVEIFSVGNATLDVMGLQCNGVDKNLLTKILRGYFFAETRSLELQEDTPL